MAVIKDPDNKAFIELDWSDWLASDATITAAAWSLPTDLVEEAESTLSGSLTTLVYSGGTEGSKYTVTCRITYTRTSLSATDLTEDRSVAIECKSK